MQKPKDMDDELKQTMDLISRDFELENAGQMLTEEAVLRALSNQIAYMIEHKLEVLLSLMYRLDVKEEKVELALSPASTEPANVALARLVLERQKQRVFTKNYYRQDGLDGWDDF